MENINFDTILSFLNELPQAESSYLSEEIHTREIPADWIQIGSLVDERIGLNYAMYRPWTNYALGFYPYSGCDIYKTENGKIILSYIEYGGHYPFRRNFIITKKSPFIVEPVSFDIIVSEANNNDFLSVIAKYGLSMNKIEKDILRYKTIDQITHELNADEALVIKKYHSSVSNDYQYTMVMRRENAVKLKSELNLLWPVY
ncbi:MAG: hypothetical protein V4506_13805 [Bacteroidota bacterium]